MSKDFTGIELKIVLPTESAVKTKIDELQKMVNKHKINIDLNLSKDAIDGLEKLGKQSSKGFKETKKELSQIETIIGKINKESRTFVNDKEIKRVTELNRGLGETTKIIQSIHRKNPTIVDTNNELKKIDTLKAQLQKLNKFQQDQLNLSNKAGMMAPGSDSLVQHQLQRIQKVIDNFKKQNADGIVATPEQLMKIQNLENRIKRLYDTIKNGQKDSKGFDFKQYESFNKLNPKITEVRNKQEYYNKSLLEGHKLIKTMTQETERYIKVTQQLRQGSVHKDIGVYIDKNTGQMYRFNEAVRDGITRSWGLGEAISTAGTKAMIWTTVMGSFYGLLNVLQDIGRTIVALDTQLTELSKVSNTDVGFDSKIMDQSIKSATLYGRTITEVLDSNIEFSRQGFDTVEMLKLTEAALLGANVTGIKTAEMAQYLTATMLQYNLTLEQTVSIVDKINEVDNNFAVTSQGLAQAIAKSGESAQQFGVTLDELIGMVTAISSATKESGKVVGNMMKTVFARLASDKSANALQSIGIAVKDVNGELRSATDVYGEVATQWDNMTRAEKMYIAESLAGWAKVILASYGVKTSYKNSVNCWNFLRAS